jgi:hypothetical protein
MIRQGIVVVLISASAFVGGSSQAQAATKCGHHITAKIVSCTVAERVVERWGELDFARRQFNVRDGQWHCLTFAPPPTHAQFTCYEGNGDKNSPRAWGTVDTTHG